LNFFIFIWIRDADIKKMKPRQVKNTLKGRGCSFALELAKELLLLLVGLEATMSKFGRSIDELKIDLFEGRSRGLLMDALSESEDPLFDSSGGALDHHEVFVDDTVAREATHRGNGLLGKIDGSRSTVLVTSLRNAIDLLIDFGTVVITVLTGTGDGPLHATRMPSSDTSNLSKTFVGLAGKTGSSPTGGHTFVSLTLGDTDDINHLVFLEDRGNRDGLLKETNTESNFLRNVSSVDLDFHQVGFLLSDMDFTDLGVDQKTDDAATFTKTSEISVDGLLLLVSSIVQGIFSKCHFL